MTAFTLDIDAKFLATIGSFFGPLIIFKFMAEFGSKDNFVTKHQKEKYEED